MPTGLTRKAAAAIAACVLIGCGSSDTPSTTPGQDPPPAHSGPFGDPDSLALELPAGFSVQVAAAAPTPTALSFSPDGDTLYVSSLAGAVLSYPVLLDGLLLGPPVPFLADVEMPLGVLATEHGVFVSVVQDNAGAVLRAVDNSGDGIADTVDTVLGDLPIGRHNTNGLAIGPDGMLYVLNGNSTDSGFRSEGGPPEQPPYSGSLLRVDPLATDLTPQPSMVVATGWRNIYDIAFVPAEHPQLREGLAAIAENGPDGETYQQPDGSAIQRPVGEDTLSLVDVGNGVIEHFGFPWCLYDRDQGGLQGFTQAAGEGGCTPLPADAAEGLPQGVVRAHPVALFGRHVSANGLAFNPGGNFPEAFDGDLFVAQFGNFSGTGLAGRKIVRVRFSADDGSVEAVENFMSSVAPLGLRFGPDKAMWVADFLAGSVLRVSALF